MNIQPKLVALRKDRDDTASSKKCNKHKSIIFEHILTIEKEAFNHLDSTTTRILKSITHGALGTPNNIVHSIDNIAEKLNLEEKITLYRLLTGTLFKENFYLQQEELELNNTLYDTITKNITTSKQPTT